METDISLRIRISPGVIAAIVLTLTAVSIFALAYSGISARLHRTQNKRIAEKLLIAAADYHSESSAYSTVYFLDEDAEYATLVSRLVDSYYPLLIKDFCLDSGNKSFDRTVKVVIYPSAQELANGMGLDFGMLPMGVYYGGVLNILSPREWAGGGNSIVAKNEMIEHGPIVHELTHLALDIRTDGRYPTWFTEGVALYYEQKYIGSSYLDSLGSGAGEISFSALEKSFGEIDVRKAYMRAYGVIAFIVERGGEAALQELISDLAEGRSFRKAFEKRTGCPIEVLR